MDWTRLFEDDGSKLCNPLQDSKASRLAILFPHHYTPFVAYCFTLNYVLGVGALGIPFAFQQAGILLSSLILVLVVAITSLTVSWTTESMSVAQALFSIREGHVDPDHPQDREEQGLNGFTGTFGPVSTPHMFRLHRKLEVSAICELVGGDRTRRMFELSLLFLMYSGLWAYSAVFASALASVLPHLHISYILLGFAVLVVPLSCLELTEQLFVQVLLTGMRAVTFLLMLSGTTSSLLTLPSSPPVLFEWSGLGLCFTTCLFSLLFQHSVPGLLFPLQDRTKSQSIFTKALVTCFLLYLCLGVLCALVFSDDTKPSVNLNFQGFSFTGSHSSDSLPTWQRIFNLLIVLFPAMDTLSVFPLISVTLGNNLQFALDQSLAPSTSFYRKTKALRIICRLLACIPPIVAAGFLQSLDTILQISGLFAVYIAILNPCILIYSSRRKLLQHFGVHLRTHFSSSDLLSSPAVIFSVALIGLATVLFSMVQLALKL